MIYRVLAAGIAGTMVVAIMVAFSTTSVVAQQAPSTRGTEGGGGARTPWGEPDLQGIWSAGTITALERPAKWADRPALSPKEAADWAAEVAARPGSDANFGPDGRLPLRDAYNNIFWAWGGGPAQLLNDGRTSLIVDPPNGKIPPFSQEGIRRENAHREWLRMLVTGSEGGIPGPISPHRKDPPPIYNTEQSNAGGSDPETRATRERSFGSPLPYETDPAAFVRIVQSPGVVALVADLHQGHGHNRTVNIGRGHVPSHIRLLLGDSIGRWEGNTLVVDTTNFTFKMDFHGSRENLHLVERFTRMSDGRLVWRVTLEDPTTWTRPWTYEVAWTRVPDKSNPVYEQSNHEGNFGIIGILAGRRHAERLHEEGKGPDPQLLNTISNGTGPALIGPDGTLPPGAGRND